MRHQVVLSSKSVALDRMATKHTRMKMETQLFLLGPPHANSIASLPLLMTKLSKNIVVKRLRMEDSTKQEVSMVHKYGKDPSMS